jgi:hypothetical protein
VEDLRNCCYILKTLGNTKPVDAIRLLLLNLLLAGILFFAFTSLSDFSFVPCTYASFEPVLLALASLLALNILLAIFWRQRVHLSLVVLASLLLGSIYLGSYHYSPLRFPKGDNAILKGFLVSRQGRVNEVVASGDIIALSTGVPATISIRSELRSMSCRWSSRNSGVWDDPSSCDTTYMPPAADYDVLTVRIEPGCQLPSVRGQLKISIIP